MNECTKNSYIKHGFLLRINMDFLLRILNDFPNTFDEVRQNLAELHQKKKID